MPVVMKITINFEDEETDGQIHNEAFRIVLPEYITTKKKFKRVFVDYSKGVEN